MHIMEATVDIGELAVMSDVFVDLQLACEVVVDETGKLSTAFHTTKRATTPGAASNELEPTEGRQFHCEDKTLIDSRAGGDLMA
jgi:hypothetical protein